MSTPSSPHKPICLEGKPICKHTLPLPYTRGRFGYLKRLIIDMVKEDPSEWYAKQSVINTVRRIVRRTFGKEFVVLIRRKTGYTIEFKETDKISLPVLEQLYQMEEEEF